jgi:Ca-activated chloride channel family protein
MFRTLSKTLALLAGLAGGLQAAPYAVQAQLDRPVLDAHGDRSVILRVNLEGLRERLRGRPPLNIALVVDRSGSMAGDKLDRAKEAARNIVERLDRDDIFSLVSFDDQVKVELRAGRVGDRREAYNAINRLQPGGSTALYAGVQAAIGQAREMAGRGRLSRVLLLSDGLANVGPDKPADARRLGKEAARHGVTVSTFGLGLGYDEDLLTALSQASDGNHAFIRDSRDLAGILDHELGDALAVAARDIVIEIRLADGVRYRRCLDREVEVDGRTLRLKLGQLASGQEKQLLIELEAPQAKAGDAEDLARVTVQGSDAEGRPAPAQDESLRVRYTADAKEADESRNAAVVAESIKAEANEAREQAVALRDQGKADEASALLKSQARSLRASAAALPAAAPAAAEVQGLSDSLESEAGAVSGSGDDWNATRKSMKAKAYQLRNGQSYQE